MHRVVGRPISPPIVGPADGPSLGRHNCQSRLMLPRSASCIAFQGSAMPVYLPNICPWPARFDALVCSRELTMEPDAIDPSVTL